MTEAVKVRIAISSLIGLLIVGTISAIAFAVAVTIVHQQVDASRPTAVVQSKPGYEQTVSSVPLPQVNEAARDEMKQGIFGRRVVVQPSCPTCPQGVPYYPAPAVTPVPENKPAPQPASGQPTVPSRIGANDKPLQSPTRFEITLFLDGSAKSQQLANWFKTDPTLVQWRSQCSYQEYTPDSPLYNTLKNRDGVALKEAVPASKFPAVVFSAPGGAHIHAAGGNMLPNSAAELIADVRKGNELFKQVSSQNNGLIRTSGYSWDEAIHPAMRLTAEECPDGKCPVPSETGWKPGKIVKDVFGTPAKEGIVKDALWGWLDIIVGAVAAVVLAVIAAGFAAFVLVLWVLKRD